MPSTSISIVIPVINEEARVARAIRSAWACGGDQVVIADGGSSDRTLEIALAEADGCEVAHSLPGRGTQQNAGARLAEGDVILFVHADSWLDENACDQIREWFESGSGSVSGGFEQRIENDSGIYRLIEKGNRWRAIYRGLLYGDQGLFVKRAVFEELGGFPDIPLMEDWKLSRALSKIHRHAILPGKIHVDARRWERHGVASQTIRNWWISTRYMLGASPEKLAEAYRRHDR